MATALFILRNSACKIQGLRAFTNAPQNLLYPSGILNNTKFSKKFTQLASSNKGTVIVVKSPLLVSQSQRCMSADHSKLWPIEKALTVSMLGILPATFLFPNPILDNLFAITTVIHMHWGLEACIQDYVRPIIFGPFIPSLAMGLLYAISITTLGSLLYYNYHDLGIGKTFRLFWEIKE